MKCGDVGLKAPHMVRSYMNQRIIILKASKTGFNPLHKTRSILAVNKRGVPQRKSDRKKTRFLTAPKNDHDHMRIS